MLVSSTNSMNFNNLVELEISLIYKINNNGSRILQYLAEFRSLSLLGPKIHY